jgi:hypothetical protein
MKMYDLILFVARHRGFVLFLSLMTLALKPGVPVSGDDSDLALLFRATAEIFDAERERARADLDRYTAKRDQAKRITAARQWALSSFEAKDRGNYGTPPDLSSRVRHARLVSNTLRTYLLEFPNHPQTRMEIKSGRALNWFLEALGPTSLDHELMRERVSEEIKEVEAELRELQESLPPLQAPLGSEAVNDSQNTQYERLKQLRLRHLELREYQRVLKEDIVSRPVITEQVRGKITYKIGESNAPYLMRNTPDSALPLRWPSIIERNPQYAKACKTLEQARDLALEQLREENHISIETQSILFDTADALDREFQKDFSAFCKRMEMNSVKNGQYAEGLRFVRGLRTSLVRFVQAESIQDVELHQVFNGDRIEQLLAFMSRNGLKFAEAEVISEPAYRVLYNEMVKFYLDMKSLELAQLEAESDEQGWQQMVNAKMDALKRDMTDDLRAALESATRPDSHTHIHYEISSDGG